VDRAHGFDIAGDGGRDDRGQFVHRQRRELDHLDGIAEFAEEAQRARHVPRRQHEPVGRAGQARDEVVQHVPKAREVLERAELEHFIEQEGDRPVVLAACALQERERRVERRAGRRRVDRDVGRKKRRRLHDAAQHPLRGGRASLDVHVLAAVRAQMLAQRAEQVRPARAAAADEDGEPAGRRFQGAEHQVLELRARERHDSATDPRRRRVCAIGITTPRRAAASRASG
jgi:hypothetical protein